MHELFDLTGKVAIITGSSKGIGKAIALKLASEGARLVVNDLDPAPAAETLAAVGAIGGEAVSVVGDVTGADFAQRFIGAATAAYGGIDIIVNNAGYTWDGVIQNMTDPQWQAMLDVHVTAPFRILRAAAGVIKSAAKQEAAEGRRVTRKVVNISSVSGLFGNAGQVNYGAAKAAVVGMTRSLAKEWGRYNVTVNCVAFGLIETRLTQPVTAEGVGVLLPAGEIRLGMPEEALAAIKKATPLGRAGSPEDAAGAVYLLCSPESDFISGQVLIASGGLVL
jgi:3-oxoacyl-[acyl-carrier protein] reductase